MEKIMATWNDVKLWMSSQNYIFTDEGQYVDLTFNYTDTDRSQFLRIGHTPVGSGVEAITFESAIASYNPLKTEELLLAAISGVGGVAIREYTDGKRYFVLQTTVPLADVDASELEFYIRIIALRADWLEAEIFRVDRV